jgi:hypothetical protein
VHAHAAVKRVRELHDRIVADVVVEGAVGSERRRIGLGVARVERPVVRGVELLNVDEVLRGEFFAGPPCA